MSSLKNGVAIATAAAALFTAGLASTSVQAAEDGGVKCTGTNGCKGKSECKSAKNECKGHNGCKGMGWVKAKSDKACTEAGGTVVEKK